MIHITMHGFEKAEARVYRGESEGWFATLSMLDDEMSEVQLFSAPRREHKVQAIMDAFDLVDKMKAAVQKLADDEGMKDLQESVESLPRTEYTLTGEGKT